MQVTENIDVICQHSSDGTIIPLRVRIKDEEGESHVYNIKGYKDLSHRGALELPNGVFVCNNSLSFECKIIVFGRQKTIWLYYSLTQHKWGATV